MDKKPVEEFRQSKVALSDAAVMLSVTPQFLRIALQQGRFPFGTAVKMKRWAYYINSERFYNYISGRKEVV